MLLIRGRILSKWEGMTSPTNEGTSVESMAQDGSSLVDLLGPMTRSRAKKLKGSMDQLVRTTMAATKDELASYSVNVLLITCEENGEHGVNS